MKTVEELNRMSLKEVADYCKENSVSVEINNGIVTGVVKDEEERDEI